MTFGIHFTNTFLFAFQPTLRSLLACRRAQLAPRRRWAILEQRAMPVTVTMPPKQGQAGEAESDTGGTFKPTELRGRQASQWVNVSPSYPFFWAIPTPAAVSCFSVHKRELPTGFCGVWAKSDFVLALGKAPGQGWETLRSPFPPHPLATAQQPRAALSALHKIPLRRRLPTTQDAAPRG